VVKTALIVGARPWERVRALGELDPAELGDVIFACVRTKLEIVAADERDSGRRAVLNLGHTVGHAIEAASGYERYRHGEAVGLGLLATLRLSGAGELRDEVRNLLDRHGLPTRLDPAIDVGSVLAAIERDKKRTADGVGFVLLERAGEPATGQRVDPDSVRAAVEELR
jgi:shikimate kinase/3-dehydroquinate synthase